MQLEIIKVQRTYKGKGITVTFKENGTENVEDIRKSGGEKYPRILVGCDLYDGRVWFMPTRQEDPRTNKFQLRLDLIEIDTFQPTGKVHEYNPPTK